MILQLSPEMWPESFPIAGGGEHADNRRCVGQRNSRNRQEAPLLASSSVLAQRGAVPYFADQAGVGAECTPGPRFSASTSSRSSAPPFAGT